MQKSDKVCEKRQKQRKRSNLPKMISCEIEGIIQTDSQWKNKENFTEK